MRFLPESDIPIEDYRNTDAVWWMCAMPAVSPAGYNTLGETGR